MTAARPRVAFVVQRSGTEVNGGAEALALAVARRVAHVADLTIVTTTARDYDRWAPHYRAGEDTIEGVRVLRFDVDVPRDGRAFDALSAKLVGMAAPSAALQDAWMRAQGPYSSGLLRYVEDHRDEYDVWFFFTYLYATTYFALPLVAERAVLVPFAHDEWPLRFPMWERFFALPRAFVFSAPEEQAFLQRRFPALALAGPVVGLGIDLPQDVDPARFRRATGIGGSFALYVGRVDASKGVPALLDDFALARRLQPDLALVLIGRLAMELAESYDGVHALGFTSESEKLDALAAAEALVMPSALESLSIVLLEAWSVGTPVIVYAGSEVTVGQCRRSQGGLWYRDGAELASALRIVREDGVRARLGAAGRRYVARTYTWDTVVERYRDLIASVMTTQAQPGSA